MKKNLMRVGLDLNKAVQAAEEESSEVLMHTHALKEREGGSFTNLYSDAQLKAVKEQEDIMTWERISSIRNVDELFTKEANSVSPNRSTPLALMPIIERQLAPVRNFHNNFEAA
jgi:hypothetical protein